MNCSTRGCHFSLVAVAFLGLISILLPLGSQGFARSEGDQLALLRALESLSVHRMLTDVTTLSSPAFNGRQTGTADDASSAKWIADQVAGEIREQLRAQAITPAVISGLLSALGGRENVREIEAVASSRLRVRVANATAVDEGAIRSLGLRGIARPAADRVHVLVGPSANEALTLLRALIAS